LTKQAFLPDHVKNTFDVGAAAGEACFLCLGIKLKNFIAGLAEKSAVMPQAAFIQKLGYAAANRVFCRPANQAQ
jgi:hypothetical protein